MKTAKRALALLLSLMLVLGTAAAGGVSVSALSGSGTADDPYQIESYEELKEFAVIVNGTDEVDPNPSACAVLTADIIANDKKWVPIAKSSDRAFTGTFDGDGHKITGLDNSESDSRDDSGLFGFIGEGGAVQNTALENADLTGIYIGGIARKNNGTISGCSFGGTIACEIESGGLAGKNYGTITNCYNTGNISGENLVGGIVGNNLSAGTITNCYNTGDVSSNGYPVGGLAGDSNGTVKNCYNTGDVSGTNYVGGVAGINENGGEVTDCYNTGNVTATGDGASAGGVAGSVQTRNSAWVTTVTNCYSTGAVNALGENAQYIGGVIGYLGDSCTVENCYYDNEKCGCGKAVGTAADTSTVKGLTTAQMTGESALDNMPGLSSDSWLTKENADGWAYYPHLKGFAYDSSSTDANWPAKTEYTAPAGPTVFEISNYDELKEFAEIVNGNEDEGIDPNPSACAVLTADIYATYNPVEDPEEDEIEYAKDWVPIAKSDRAFTGTFDGGGHKITGLDNSESGSRDETGLFGFIGEGGSVKDVRLESADLSGNNIGGIAHENRGTISGCSFGGTIACQYNAGGLAGKNYGTITNCYNTGNVSGNSPVGGIAGINYSEGTITNCYNTGDVSGYQGVGGIAGNSKGTVKNCYNTGNVTGNNQVGGVAGSNMNNGKVTDCYNTGNVTATGDYAHVGGVAGLMDTSNSTQNCSLTNCYNAGTVTAQGENAGGVVGCLGDNCTVENCYYDNEKCGCGKAVGNADDTGSVKGLATAQMTGESALESMTFSYDEGVTSPWLTKENADGWAYYPHLKGFAYDSSSTDANWPAKTEYTAPAGPTVFEISNYEELKEFAVIVNGTDEVAPNPSACAVLTADIIAKNKKWIPIANGSDRAFTGTFDGGGHKITGLDNSESDFDSRYYSGLFGFIGEGGSVKNLRLESANFGGNDIGGIARENRGTISGCSFGGTIACIGWAGGIAGFNYGTITNCYNTGNVTGNEPVGGIAGKNRGTISNCCNTGNVSGNGSVGGIAGDNGGTITNCYSTGNVSGTDYVGGVAGNNMNIGEVTNCYNTGNVTATGDGATAGGVAGLMDTSNSAWTCSVTNCYSTGAVTVQGENADAGGVVGYLGNNCTVENCYYDNEKCGCEKAVGTAADTDTVKGLTTAEMTGADALTNLAGFSDEVWLAQEYVYPVLRSVPDNHYGYIIAEGGTHANENRIITVFIPGDRSDEGWLFDFTVCDSEGIVITETKETDCFDSGSGLTCSEAFEVSGLDAGDYTVSATVRDGVQTAGVVIVPASFTILPVETEITINPINPVSVSDKAVITLSVAPEGAVSDAEDVVVYIDGAEYTPEEVDGVLTVTVPCIYYNGQQFSAEEKRLEAGHYLVRAEFKGNQNYTPAEDAEVLSVAKRQPTIAIDVEEVYREGEIGVANVTVTGAEMNNSNTAVLVDGETSELVEHCHIFVPSTVGEHTIAMIFPGDRNNEFCANATTIKVIPNFGNGILTVSVPDANADEHAVATVYAKELYPNNRDVVLTVKNSAGETVLEKTVQLGDYDYTEGYASATADLGALTPGDYTIEAFYSSDTPSSNTGGCETSSAFSVRESTSLSINAPQNLAYGDDAVIGFDFSASGSEGEIKAFVDGTQYTVSVGEPLLTVSGLEAGSHLVCAYYEGDGTHAPAEAAAVFDIEKADVTADCEMEPVIRTDENAEILLAFSPADVTGTLTLSVDDTDKTIPVADGTARLTLDKLSEGRHILTVYYPGNVNYNPFFASYEFSVVPTRGRTSARRGAPAKGETDSPAAVVLSIKPVAPVIYGDEAVVELELSDPTATGAITVTINGFEYVTDTEHLTLTVPTCDPLNEPDTHLDAGGYLVTAEYEGDETHAPAKAYELLNVNKRQHTISVEFTEKDGVKLAEIITTSDQAISCIIDGKYYSVNNSCVDISELAPGRHTMIAVSGVCGGQNGYFYFKSTVNDEIALTVVSFTVSENGMTVSAPDTQLGEQSQINVAIPDSVYNSEAGDSSVSLTVRDSGGSEVFSEDITQLALNSTTGMWEASVNYTPEETGTHTAYLTYRYGDTYADTVADTFSVYEIETAITITKPEKVVAGEDAEITVSLTPAGATGAVTVYVDGEEYTPDASGKVTVPALEAGGHLIEAVYEGDGTFAPSTAYDVLAIEKEEQTLILDVEDIGAGDSEGIGVTLSSRTASGMVTILINNEDYSRELADGNVQFEVEDLPAGKYIVSAYYPGDENHSAAFAIDSFTVVKLNCEITIGDFEARYGETVEVTVTVDDCSDATGTITVNDDETYEVENGVATFPFTPAAVGDYNIHVKYSGDDKYYGAETDKEFEVAKGIPTMTVSVSPEEPVYGDDVTITASLPSDAEGTVTFTFGGTTYTADVENGKAVCELLDDDNHIDRYPGAGRHEIKAEYSGDAKYSPVTLTDEFTIGKATPVINLTVNPENPVYGDSIIITAKLHDSAVGKVTFTVTGENYNYTSDEIDIIDGAAQIELDSLIPGSYTVKADYTGDDAFNPGSKEIPFEVGKLDPEINVTAEDITYGETEEMVITSNAEGTVTVTIEETGEEFEATLDGGEATVSISGLKPGEYHYKVLYGATVNYNEKEVTGSFTVNSVDCALTINYVYADGTEAAETYTDSVEIFKEYSVESPEITGYTPDIATVEGTMGDEDMNGKTVTVTYTANTYKVTYVVDGEKLTEMDATFGQSVPRPRTPQRDGYSFKWVDEIPATMPAENITINGKFTAIEYTATFVDENGETVEKVTFTVEDESITEPDVPEKAGYAGEWEEYTLGASDITIRPVYKGIASVEIENFEEQSEIGYKEDKTFTVKAEDLPEGAEIHWFVNGEDVGTGESYTVEDPTDDYTVQAKVIDKNGNTLDTTKIQSVKVRNGFFDRLKAFFAELIEKILGKAIADLLSSIC